MMTYRAKLSVWAWGVVVIFLFLMIPCGQTIAQQASTSDQDRQELEAYRTYVPALIKELDQAKSQSAIEPPEIQSYRKYLVQYYEQQAELQIIRTQMFRWQRSAGNWILFLIVVLTLGGLLLAGYQLFMAARMGQRMGTTGFEASIQKVQITTSTVGLVVLIVSGLLLLAFQREVYPVRPEQARVSQPSTE